MVQGSGFRAQGLGFRVCVIGIESWASWYNNQTLYFYGEICGSSGFSCYNQLYTFTGKYAEKGDPMTQCSDVLNTSKSRRFLFEARETSTQALP